MNIEIDFLNENYSIDLLKNQNVDFDSIEVNENSTKEGTNIDLNNFKF